MNLYDVFDLCTDKMVIHNGKTEDIVEQLQVTKTHVLSFRQPGCTNEKKISDYQNQGKICLAEKELQRQEFAKNWTQFCEPFLKMEEK